jgi:hypothetical protein
MFLPAWAHLLNAPSFFLACPCFCLFNIRLAYPDKAFFARRCPRALETRCPRPAPTLGLLEILAPCSGMSVLRTPKRRVYGFTSGRFLTTGLSLPLAEISTTSLLAADGPLSSAPELPVPAEGFLVEISL